MAGSGNKISVAYLFMLLILRKMQCSENRQNIKEPSLLRKTKIPSRFVNVRIDRVVTPHMLNESLHSAALKCEDPFTANQIQFELN